MKKRVLSLIAVAMMVFVIGCSDDDGEGLLNNSNPDDLGSGAELRVVHLSPDAPAVDVYVAGRSTPVATNVQYGAATGYLDLAPGTYDFQIRAAGSSSSSTPAYSTGNLSIAQDARITALAAGLLNSSDSSDNFRVIPLVENFGTTGNTARVRIIHASADAPTVAIDLGDDAASAAQAEVANFARFTGDTGADGVELPAGQALQVAIWAGGARFTAFTTPALPAGGEIFVFASGLLANQPGDDKGFSLLAVGPAGVIGQIKQNPVVFALHGSPDAGQVDILAGTTELVSDLNFGEMSQPLQVPPAAYTLTFRTLSGATVDATTPALAAGERYLAVASGFAAGTPSFTLLPYSDSLMEPANGAAVRVIHASPDAPPVDVGTENNGVVTPVPDFTNLDFEDASPAMGTALPAANLSIGIAGAGTTSAVATFDITTVAGLRAFVVAAGSLQGNGESFRLLVVDATGFPWQCVEVLPNP